MKKSLKFLFLFFMGFGFFCNLDAINRTEAQRRLTKLLKSYPSVKTQVISLCKIDNDETPEECLLKHIKSGTIPSINAAISLINWANLDLNYNEGIFLKTALEKDIFIIIQELILNGATVNIHPYDLFSHLKFYYDRCYNNDLLNVLFSAPEMPSYLSINNINGRSPFINHFNDHIMDEENTIARHFIDYPLLNIAKEFSNLTQTELETWIESMSNSRKELLNQRIAYDKAYAAGNYKQARTIAETHGFNNLIKYLLNTHLEEFSEYLSFDLQSNKPGETLIKAAMSGHTALVKHILDTYSITKIDLEYALSAAINYCEYDTIKILMEHPFARGHLIDPQTGESIFQMAFNTNNKKVLDAVFNNSLNRQVQRWLKNTTISEANKTALPPHLQRSLE